MNFKLEILGESAANIPALIAEGDEFHVEVTLHLYEDAEWCAEDGTRQKLPPGCTTMIVKAPDFAAWARGCAAVLSQGAERA